VTGKTEPRRVSPEGVLAARAALERFLEAKTWLALPVGIVGCVLVALLERRHGVGAADRALSGAAFGLSLPILAYLVTDSSLSRRRLSTNLSSIVRHGGSPSAAASGTLASVLLFSTSTGALLGALTTFVARAGTDGAWLRDVGASAWIGILGGAAYASAFVFASSFGKRGGGRQLLFALDFLFGISSSALALPWPRSHIRNLIGGTPPLELSQPASAAALVLIAGLTAIFAVRRARA